MTNLLFSPESSPQSNANTLELYEWLKNHFAIEKLPENLQQALETGEIDVFARDILLHTTTLHEAARSGNVNAMEWLLHHGADKDTLDKFGRNSMHYAVENGQIEAMELLHQQDMNLEVTGVQGRSLLHYAAANGQRDAVKWLLDHGADIHEANNLNAETALHLAANSIHAELCEYLIQQGADIDARDKDGRTPLHDAATYTSGQASCVALLQHGANLNVRDRETDIASVGPQHREAAQPVFDAWVSGTIDPATLTIQQVNQMLSVWPLENPKAPVPRFAHLDAIFGDPRWQDEHAEHKLDLIQQIPGLSSREQIFLMGGHARTLMQKRNEAPQTQGAER